MKAMSRGSSVCLYKYFKFNYSHFIVASENHATTSDSGLCLRISKHFFHVEDWTSHMKFAELVIYRWFDSEWSDNNPIIGGPVGPKILAKICSNITLEF